MPDEPTTSLNGILGSTADISAGSAVESIQAEQIKRLEAEKQQAEASPVPLSATDMMQEAAAEAQARADAAASRAAGFEAYKSAPTSVPLPSSAGSVPLPGSGRRSSFDAEAANARAANASRGFPVAQDEGKITFSAPKDAGSAFDAFAYDDAIHAQSMASRGYTSAESWDAPAGNPNVAPSPLYSSPSSSDDLWAGRVTPQGDIINRVDLSMGGSSDGLPSRLDTIRARPGDSWADARQSWVSSKNEPLADKFDSFADTAARFGVDTGVLGERARGIGSKALSNIREDFNEKSGFGKLNYAYGAAQLAQGAARDYSENNSGQYLTPEQKETANAGLLPGFLSMGGAAIGAATGIPGASWAGSLVAGGIGQAAQGVIGANEQREQAAREAGERLAASLGAAAESAGAFKAQLEATGGPIASLSQGLSALQATGPGVGAGAIAGAARSALSEGEYYGADTAATAKFLASNPALAPLAQTYRTNGELSRQQYQSIAQLALAEGDTGEFNAAQMQASRATLNTDAQYQTLAKNQQADASSWGNQIGHLATEAGHHLGFQWLGMSDEDPIVQDQLRLDRRKAEVDKQNGLDAQKYVQEFADINTGRQGLIEAGLSIKTGQAGLATAEASGGGAAALRRLAPGIAASYDAASAADQTLITTDTAMMNGLAPNDPARAGFQTLINQARADQVQNPLAKVQLARSAFEATLQESESAYGLDLAGRESGLTRGLLSGRRYDQLAGDEYGLVSSESARAAQLRRDAVNPINDPARRDAMLAQATALETQSAVQQHDFQQNAERQTLGGLDVRIAGAAQQVGQAQAFGSPGEVYSAQSRELDALRAKFSELTGELQRGGLTVDETRQKESELIQVRGQAVQVTAQQRDERVANNRGLAEDDVTLATAGIKQQIQQGGSASVNAGAVSAAYDSALAADRDAITQYAPGTRERRDAEAAYATKQAQKQDAMDSLNIYSPSAATRLGDVEGQANLRRAQSAFALEEISPYRSGAPGSSPFTAALGLEGALKGDIALQGRDQAAADAFRAGRQKSGQWDDVAEAGYAADKERRSETVDSDRLRMGQVEHDRSMEMLKALPLMIAGGGGMQGTSSGVVGFDALTAAFSPNVLQGSWGHPANARGAAQAGSVPGSAYDGFQAHAAGVPGASPASLTTAIQTLAHNTNNQQVASILQQVLMTLQRMETNGRQRMPGQAGPPRTGMSAAVQNGSQTFNSNRPGLR